MTTVIERNGVQRDLKSGSLFPMWYNRRHFSFTACFFVLACSPQKLVIVKKSSTTLSKDPAEPATPTSPRSIEENKAALSRQTRAFIVSNSTSIVHRSNGRDWF